MLTARAQHFAIAALLLLAQACSSGPAVVDTTPRATPGPARAQEETPEPPRSSTSLRLLADAEPAGLSELFSAQAPNVNRPIWPMVHDFMFAFDPLGNPLLHLLSELPSQQRGTWRVNADGTMETLYRLKQGVKWQDGTEFTAQDLVFGWTVAADPQVPYGRRTVVQAIDRVEAPDPYTIQVSWKRLYPWADRIQPGDWDPLPVHILGAAYGSGSAALLDLPYWRGQFVGLGAYNVIAWEPSSHLLLRANERYHLGRPRIDSIEIWFVPSENARLATLVAGEADMMVAQMGTLGPSARRTLEERWSANEAGSITPQGASSLTALFPKWTNPLIGGSSNTGVRRALLYGLDRNVMAQAAMGDVNFAAESWIAPSDPRTQSVGSRVVRYPHDPGRAAQLLRDAGWQPEPDGVLRNGAGQRLELEARIPDEELGEIVRESWRPLGIDTAVLVPTVALDADPEWQATFPGVMMSTLLPTSATFYTGRLRTESCASERNSWTGPNRQCYQDTQVDQLVDQLYRAPSDQQRLPLEAQIVEIVTRDAAFFPAYRTPRGYAIQRDGVTNVPVMQVVGPTGDLPVAFNVHEWALQR